MKAVPWSYFMVQQVLGLLRVEQVHSLSFCRFGKGIMLCVWTELKLPARHRAFIWKKVFFFFLALVIQCNAYFSAWVKPWETPALSSQQDGVAAALGPAFEREGNRESCQKVREWEFETKWDSEQAFIYATIFNPTPSRLSEGFLSRTLRKQAWLSFLPARWAAQSQSGKDRALMTRHWLKRKKS